MAPMRKIFLQPISGLANRLRSVASSLALFPDKVIFCYWGENLVTEVGDPPFFHPRLTYVDKNTFDEATADIKFESRGVNEFPKNIYLWHPLGEHYLIPGFLEKCAQSPLTQIVIRSGGWFGLGTKRELEQQRRATYKELNWAQEITDKLQTNIPETRHLGLHIRGKDLEQYSPSPAKIERSLVKLSRKLEIAHVYVSADTQQALDIWVTRLTEKGFKVLTQNGADLNRNSSKGLISSAVDFLALSRSHAMVYGLASSFGHEAAIQGLCPRLSRSLYPAKGASKFALNQFLNSSAARIRLESLSGRLN